MKIQSLKLYKSYTCMHMWNINETIKKIWWHLITFFLVSTVHCSFICFKFPSFSPPFYKAYRGSGIFFNSSVTTSTNSPSFVRYRSVFLMSTTSFGTRYSVTLFSRTEPPECPVERRPLTKSLTFALIVPLSSVWVLESLMEIQDSTEGLRSLGWRSGVFDLAALGSRDSVLLSLLRSDSLGVRGGDLVLDLCRLGGESLPE